MQAFTSLSYSGGNITRAALPTVAAFYASITAALAALNDTAGNFCAVFEDFGPYSDGRARRISLQCSIEGSVDQTAEEMLYLVTPSSLDSVAGIQLEPLVTGVVLWTAGNVFPSGVGARANHRMAKAVAFTDAGLLEARTTIGLKAVSREPASIEIYDIGECRGILRVMRRVSATAVAPMSMRWR